MTLLDRKVQEAGFPETLLVENAGRSVWDWLKSGTVPRFPGEILVLAGGGHNGADALAAARHCLAFSGCRVRAVLSGGTLKPLTALQLGMLQAFGVQAEVWSEDMDLGNPDLILDGLLGIGFAPPLRPGLSKIFRAAEKTGGIRVALDVPSGLYPGADDYLSCHHTLCLGHPKTPVYLPGLREACGRVWTLNIGFPPGMGEEKAPGRLLDPSDLADLVPPLSPGAHKGRRGHAGILGGAVGTSGAPVLAAEGACAARAGLVTALVPRSIYPSAASRLTGPMVVPWEDFRGNWGEFDALVAGPGWREGDREAVLVEILAAGLPLVLDASALDVLISLWAAGRNPPLDQAVLTPHPGEFSRLTGADISTILRDPLPLLGEFSRKHRCWTVLKGATVITAAPDGRFWICDGMNPALGTGGSGDVLAGLLGGLLAQIPEKEKAVNAAVLLHQASGKKAWETWGWFEAGRLAEAAALVLKEAGR